LSGDELACFLRARQASFVCLSHSVHLCIRATLSKPLRPCKVKYRALHHVG
jgi:hypothetical protein